MAERFEAAQIFAGRGAQALGQLGQRAPLLVPDPQKEVRRGTERPIQIAPLPRVFFRKPVPDFAYPEGCAAALQRRVERDLDGPAHRRQRVTLLAAQAVAVLQQDLDVAFGHAGTAGEPRDGLGQPPVFEQLGLERERALPQRAGRVRLQQPGVVDAFTVAGQAGIEPARGLAQVEHRHREWQARGRHGDVPDAAGAQAGPAAGERDIQRLPGVVADPQGAQVVPRLLFEKPDPFEVGTELPGELP